MCSCTLHCLPSNCIYSRCSDLCTPEDIQLFNNDAIADLNDLELFIFNIAAECETYEVGPIDSGFHALTMHLDLGFDIQN